MQFLNIPGYVGLPSEVCDLLNLFTLKCCGFAAIIISMLVLSWYLYKRIMDRRNNRIDNRNAYNILHKATFENDVIKSYRIIQRYPAAINIPHADGYTPFMRACLHGNTQLVRLMLNFGANLTHLSGKGETPFYLAIFYHIQNPLVKDASCIHTLYYAGADVNACNSKGYAPLHLAAMFGHTQLAQWLLNKGAIIAIHPDPFVLARLQGHYETAAVLKRNRLPAIE